MSKNERTKDKICNMDCFNCPYEDCINDEITDFDRKTQDESDMKIFLDGMLPKQRYVYEYNHSQSAKVVQKKYRKSKKGKDAIKRYNSSEKAKETRKKYKNSERSKELSRIWQREYRLRKKQAAAN